MGESTARKFGNQTSSPMVSELKQQSELQVENRRQKIYCHDPKILIVTKHELIPLQDELIPLVQNDVY